MKADDEAWQVVNDADDAEWFRLTGNCGHCGANGNTACDCTPMDPCGCKDLHPMGSRFAPKPIESLPLFGDADV